MSPLPLEYVEMIHMDVMNAPLTGAQLHGPHVTVTCRSAGGAA